MLVFFFRYELERAFGDLKNRVFPCKDPITYSLGAFDRRFGISEEEFLDAVARAEKIWEEPFGLDLFAYSPDGRLKINLAYDSRQEATEKLREIDAMLENDRDRHEALKAQYDSLRVRYEEGKAEFEGAAQNFEIRRVQFEELAEYWNSRGGAPTSEYENLESQRRSLGRESAELAAERDRLNRQIDEINTLAAALNQLAQRMSRGAINFNTVAKEHGEEFEEGNYESDSLGRRINVYQFEDEDTLVRLLAHELGHALGLGHADDPEAIMYRLNDGENVALSEADRLALGKLCRI